MLAPFDKMLQNHKELCNEFYLACNTDLSTNQTCYNTQFYAYPTITTKFSTSITLEYIIYNIRTHLVILDNLVAGFSVHVEECFKASRSITATEDGIPPSPRTSNSQHHTTEPNKMTAMA